MSVRKTVMGALLAVTGLVTTGAHAQETKPVFNAASCQSSHLAADADPDAASLDMKGATAITVRRTHTTVFPLTIMSGDVQGIGLPGNPVKRSMDFGHGCTFEQPTSAVCKITPGFLNPDKAKIFTIAAVKSVTQEKLGLVVTTVKGNKTEWMSRDAECTFTPKK